MAFQDLLGKIAFLNRPISWGALYFLSIFGFAFMYSTLDRAFVQSTSGSERATDLFARQVASLLVDKHMPICNGVSSIDERDDWLIIYCTNHSKLASFTVAFRSENWPEGAKQWFIDIDRDEYVTVVSYNFSENPFSGLLAELYDHPTAFTAPCYGSAVSIETARSGGFLYLSTDTYSVFPRPIECEGDPPVSSRAIFHVNDFDSWELLGALADERKGVVRSGSGNFSRMLYFSAVTATTLGYGDIVPVTETSRNLVTCQSIMGLVLIGLFLNSLTERFHTSNRNST
ncbi:MAG: potassium channel family protein [Pseudomonadota bacterium]